MQATLVVRDTAAELWDALSAAWREAASAAVAGHGWFAAALSGGRTPVGFYRALARVPGLPWSRTHLLLADERLVAPDDPASNGRMVRETLLAGLKEAPAGVHFPATAGLGVAAAAAAYERRLREAFAALGAAEPAPDLALLGVGADGHTASLFPGDAALDERARLVVGVPASAGRAARVTMTLPALNAAGRLIVLATGAGKRAVVGRLLDGDRSLPAGRLGAPGRSVGLYVDAEACPDDCPARRPEGRARGAPGRDLAPETEESAS